MPATSTSVRWCSALTARAENGPFVVLRRRTTSMNSMDAPFLEPSVHLQDVYPAPIILTPASGPNSMERVRSGGGLLGHRIAGERHRVRGHLPAVCPSSHRATRATLAPSDRAHLQPRLPRRFGMVAAAHERAGRRRTRGGAARAVDAPVHLRRTSEPHRCGVGGVGAARDRCARLTTEPPLRYDRDRHVGAGPCLHRRRPVVSRAHPSSFGDLPLLAGGGT